MHHYGRDAFLQRLSHPFWFQSFGAVMGMDWHSSGITTSVIGALKRGLGPLQDELGIYVCGGRGRHSRKTPDELLRLGDRVGFDGAALTRASRLVAKVDSAAVQDGFDLYLHGFFVTADGKWTVVQQGMNGDKRQARRYHWHSEALKSFVDAPHSAIDGPEQGEIVNLTDHRADVSRNAQLDLLSDLGPDRIVTEFERLNGTETDACAGHAAASDHARASRCPAEGRVRAAPARHAGRGGRARPGRFPGAVADARRRRAHRALAGDGRRGRARRALPLQAIPRASRSPMAARTGIPTPCRSRSTTRPSAC